MVDCKRLLFYHYFEGNLESVVVLEALADPSHAQPVDFTVLKPQTQKFLREFFVQIFVASQTSSSVLTDDLNEQTSRNRGTVEEIFIKATKIENLGLGLIFFLSNMFRGEEGFLGWASALARETLQTGMNEIPRL